jgi:hypothetical protein
MATMNAVQVPRAGAAFEVVERENTVTGRVKPERS